MEWLRAEVTSRGVVERPFRLRRGSREVPGILWLPEDATGGQPLVGLGHGGSGHKREPYILALARTLVRHHGYGVVAIDGPVHGARRTGKDGRGSPAETLEGIRRDFGRVWERDPSMTDEMVADWKAVLDAVQDLAEVGAGPVGWWGLSMGTILGLPFVAGEPRVQAAVLGLMGLVGPTRGRLAEDAAAVNCPVLFILQWDDELFPRAKGFDLFSALATSDKRLHANPGRHIQVPREEFAASAAFLAERLGSSRPSRHEPSQAAG